MTQQLHILGHLSQKENLFSYINLYVNAHSGFIHNSLKLETSQMSFDGRTVKLWHIHTTEYYSK